MYFRRFMFKKFLCNLAAYRCNLLWTKTLIKCKFGYPKNREAKFQHRVLQEQLNES